MKMSSSDDDVERNQEEDTKSTVFNLKNVLLASGILISLCIVIVLLGALGNASSGDFQNSSPSLNANSTFPSNQNAPSAEEFFFFQRDGKVYSINPSDRKLKSKYLFNNGASSHFDNVQLSKDKKRLYFFDEFSFFYEFDSRMVHSTRATLNFSGKRFLLKRPDLISYFSVLFSESGACLIRQKSIETNVIIKDYPCECSNTELPEILGQTLDGTKLLYRSKLDYYLKTLNDSDSRDRYLFNRLKDEPFYDPFFSPDGSKFLFNDRNTDYWNLVDLKKKYLSYEMKKIYFTMDTRLFQYLTLSDDMRTLYFVIKSNEEYKLHAINYKSLFDGEHSSPESAFDIGEGRTIEFDIKN